MEKFLSPFLRQGSEADVLDVHICRPSQFPENLTYDSSGVYKGIRWRLGFDRNSDGRVSAIYFYSMGFTSFLFLRFVIIPYLKHALIPLGGFYVLGSLFGVKKKVYFLFGFPGVGKSNLTLQAVSKGGFLLADGALLAFSDGMIRGLFDEIELRFHTVRDTIYWSKLSSWKRLKLHFFEMISALTKRRISFNISVSPAQLGIERHSMDPEMSVTAVIVLIKELKEKQKATFFVQRIMAWNDWYESLYGNCFCVNETVEKNQLRGNINRFLAKCDLLTFPVGNDFDALISDKNR